MTRVPSDKLVLWLLLAIPALLIGLRWTADDVWLPDLVADSGAWSARLLVAALCLTPLQHLLGHRRWLAWAIRRRRAVGVAAFAYLALHVALYVADMADLGAILDEATAPAMIAGWLGLIALVPPALASNDAAMRALGPAWKRVQRLAYPAALLTLAHWMLVHDGFGEALLTFAPLFLLQAARLWRHLTPTERIVT